MYVPYEEPWQSEGDAAAGIPTANITFESMDAFYTELSSAGFKALSHFDVSKWGGSIVLPAPSSNHTPFVCGAEPAFPVPCPTVNASSYYLQVPAGT